MIEKTNGITTIQSNTNYWIVRAGVNANYFSHFQIDEQIAIGYDRFDNLDEIKDIDYKFFRESIISKYPEIENIESNRSRAKRISDIATKIHRFVNELKIGDIVVTPGKDHILIGEIVSDAKILDTHYDSDYDTNNINDKNIIGSLNKVRHINWIKNIHRDDAEPNLKHILGVIHGIALIHDEQVITEINRTLYDFYSINGQGHSIFSVKSKDNIDFKKYAHFIKTLDKINELYSDGVEEIPLNIKTNIQSPGPIELIGDVNKLKNLIIGVKAILKNDTGALNQLPDDLREKTSEFMIDYKSEHNYDDYDFPNHTTS